MDDEIECRKHEVRFVSRFPVEPHVFGHHYCPNPYNICCSGRPCYYAHPVPFVPVYPGFGVHPHTFEPHTWCHDDLHDIYRHAHCMHEHMEHDIDHCSYLAPVESTGSNSVVKVFFPANAQIFTGRYKLVLVVKLYEPGYCKNHFRTVTVDYSDVFELVNSSDMEGEGGDVTITIGSTTTPTGINVSGTLTIKRGSYTTLTASVLPHDVVDGSVIWDLNGNSGDLSFEEIGNTCRVFGYRLGDYTIYVRSALDPSIYREVLLHVTENGSTYEDKYVDEIHFNSTQYDSSTGVQAKSSLTVGRTGELEDIVLDTTPYTEWYEGN